MDGRSSPPEISQFGGIQTKCLINQDSLLLHVANSCDIRCVNVVATFSDVQLYVS